jgi:hypothetical protein
MVKGAFQLMARRLSQTKTDKTLSAKEAAK